MMISGEFVSWVASKPVRLVAMVFMIMTLTFALVMSIGLHVHNAQLAERQIQQIERIEAEALKAREEAAKVRVESAKNKQEIKTLEKTLTGDR